MTIRDDLRHSLQVHEESEADLIALFCQPNAGDYMMSDEERQLKVKVKHIDDLPTEVESYGEDVRIIAFTKCFVYVNAHYDGRTWVTAIPRQPLVAKAQDWFPSIGGG